MRSHRATVRLFLPLLIPILGCASAPELPPSSAPADAWETALQRAEQGDPAAQQRVCESYALGDLGLERDPVLAERWCVEAARHAGNVAAQNLLGELHLYGGIAQPSLAEARRWFLATAREGDEKGAYHYGFMVAYGIGGPVSLTEAREYVERSAASGWEDARMLLADLEAGRLDRPEAGFELISVGEHDVTRAELESLDLRPLEVPEAPPFPVFRSDEATCSSGRWVGAIFALQFSDRTPWQIGMQVRLEPAGATGLEYAHVFRHTDGPTVLVPELFPLEPTTLGPGDYRLSISLADQELLNHAFRVSCEGR